MMARRSAVLSWTEPDDGGATITQYEVEVTEPGGRLHARTPFHPTATFVDLKPGATHKVRIRAHNLVGAGEWQETTLSTVSTVPGVCGRLRVMSNTGSVLRIGWDRGSDYGQKVTKYRLQYLLARDQDPPFSTIRANPDWDTFPRALSDALQALEAVDQQAAAAAAASAAGGGKRKKKRGGQASCLHAAGGADGCPIGYGAPRGFNAWQWKPYVPAPSRRRSSGGVSTRPPLAISSNDGAVDGSVGLPGAMMPSGGAVIRRTGSRGKKGIVEGGAGAGAGAATGFDQPSAFSLKRLSLGSDADRRRRSSSCVSTTSSLDGGSAMPVLPDPQPLGSCGGWSFHSVDVDAPDTKVTIDVRHAATYVRMRVIAKNDVGWGNVSPWVAYFAPDCPVCVDAAARSLTVSFGANVKTPSSTALAYMSYQLQRQVLTADEVDSNVWFRDTDAPCGPATPDLGDADAGADCTGEWLPCRDDGLPPPLPVKNLLPATRYRFRYRTAATRDDGAQVWLPWTSTVTSPWYRTANDVPEPPTGMSVVARSATEVSLSWDVPRCNGVPLLEYAFQQRMVSRQLQPCARMAMEDTITDVGAHREFRPSHWFECTAVFRRSKGPLTVPGESRERRREVWTIQGLEPGCG